MIGPRPLAGRWGQGPGDVSDSGGQLMGVDTEAAAAVGESVKAGEPVVEVKKRECSNPEAGDANKNRKQDDNKGICRQEKMCGANVDATDEGVAERDGDGGGGGRDTAEYTDSNSKSEQGREARGEERGSAPPKCVTSQLREKDLEQWGNGGETDNPGSARLVHNFLELDCRSEPAEEAIKNDLDVRGSEIEAPGKATLCAATLPDVKSKALLSAGCSGVGDEEDSDGEEDIGGDSMTGEDSEDDEHYDENDYEPESIILHEEKAKAVFDDGFEEVGEGVLFPLGFWFMAWLLFVWGGKVFF